MTPIPWKHAPKDIPVRAGFAIVSVLYPGGRYFEVHASLIQSDQTKEVNFSVGDGTLYRAGTWARTDDDRIRIHSRDTWKDNFILNTVKCDSAGKNCQTIERPIPGSWTDDTCALEGRSKTHLAQTIHCKRLSLKPLALKLNLDTLEAYANFPHPTADTSGNTP